MRRPSIGLLSAAFAITTVSAAVADELCQQGPTDAGYYRVTQNQYSGTTNVRTDKNGNLYDWQCFFLNTRKVTNVKVSLWRPNDTLAPYRLMSVNINPNYYADQTVITVHFERIPTDKPRPELNLSMRYEVQFNSDPDIMVKGPLPNENGVIGNGDPKALCGPFLVQSLRSAGVADNIQNGDLGTPNRNAWLYWVNAKNSEWISVDSFQGPFLLQSGEKLVGRTDANPKDNQTHGDVLYSGIRYGKDPCAPKG